MSTNRADLLRQDYPVWTPQLQEQNQQPPEDDDDDLDLTEDLDTDQDDADGDDPDEGGDSDDDDDDDDSDDDGEQAPAWFTASLGDFEKRIDSKIDRRINSALNKTNRRKPPADRQQPQGRQSQQEERPVVDRTSERDARMVMRETLGEQVKFLSPEERTLAVQYGRDRITAGLARGASDPEKLGEEVAGDVKTFVEANRRIVSTRTRNLLKKKGLLVEQKKEQKSTPGQGVGDAAKGSAKALEMRKQVTPGYKAPGEQ